MSSPKSKSIGLIFSLLFIFLGIWSLLLLINFKPEIVRNRNKMQNKSKFMLRETEVCPVRTQIPREDKCKTKYIPQSIYEINGNYLCLKGQSFPTPGATYYKNINLLYKLFPERGKESVGAIGCSYWSSYLLHGIFLIFGVFGIYGIIIFTQYNQFFSGVLGLISFYSGYLSAILTFTSAYYIQFVGQQFTQCLQNGLSIQFYIHQKYFWIGNWALTMVTLLLLLLDVIYIAYSVYIHHRPNALHIINGLIIPGFVLSWLALVLLTVRIGVESWGIFSKFGAIYNDYAWDYAILGGSSCLGFLIVVPLAVLILDKRGDFRPVGVV